MHSESSEPASQAIKVTGASADPADAVPSFAQAASQEMLAVGMATFTSPGYKPGTVRHIVLFKYMPTATLKQREEVKQRFLELGTLALRNGRPYIVSIETGAQTSGEGADHGMNQAFIVTFASSGDRNYYVGTPVVPDPSYFDPAHAAFKQFVGPYLADSIVFDYELPERPDPA